MWGDSRGILGNHREQSDLRKGHQPGTDAGCLSVTLEGLHRRPRATFGQGEGDHRLAPKDSSPKTQVRSQVGAEPGRRRGRGGGARAGSAPVRPPLGGAGGGPASPRSRRPGRPARGFLPRRQAAAVAAGGFARRRSSRLAARGDPAAAERTPLRGCVRLGTAPAPAGGRYRCFFLGWALAKTLLRWGGFPSSRGAPLAGVHTEQVRWVTSGTQRTFSHGPGAEGSGLVAHEPLLHLPRGPLPLLPFHSTQLSSACKAALGSISCQRVKKLFSRPLPRGPKR